MLELFEREKKKCNKNFTEKQTWSVAKKSNWSLSFKYQKLFAMCFCEDPEIL